MKKQLIMNALPRTSKWSGNGTFMISWLHCYIGYDFNRHVFAAVIKAFNWNLQKTGTFRKHTTYLWRNPEEISHIKRLCWWLFFISSFLTVGFFVLFNITY